MASNRRPRRMGAFEGTLTVIATIFCLPCICVIGSGIVIKDAAVKAHNYERPKTRKARQEKEQMQQLVRSIPRLLAPRLERHLTIGRPDAGEPEAGEPEAGEPEADATLNVGSGMEVATSKRTATVTDGQEGSALFRLPWELRRRIFEDVLGGYFVHIFFEDAYRRMSHTRCTGTVESCTQTTDHDFLCLSCTGGTCAGAFMTRGDPCRVYRKVAGAADERGNINLLALLQTCRRIYSETIELLYTQNTFDFLNLNDVLKLSRTLLPERMRLIRRVRWVSIYQRQSHLHSTPWLDECCESLSSGDCRCTICWPRFCKARSTGRMG